MNIKFLGLDKNQQNSENSEVEQFIIQREACIYVCLDFTNIKKSLQKSSLNLKLKQISPFEKFDYYSIWKNNHVMLWLWESQDRDDELISQETNPAIPETLFFAEKQSSALEIIQLKRGYEARFWDDDLLKGCRFFESAPTLLEWNIFLRNHSKGAQKSLPATMVTSLKTIPWYQPSTLEKLMAKTASINFTALILVIFACLFSYQFLAILHINDKLDIANKEHKMAIEEANDIVTARNNALRDLSIIQQIASLSKWPNQIKLLALSNQILNQLNASLISWNFNSGELLLVLKTDNMDSAAFVSAFESLGLFEKVNLNTQSSKNNLSLQMTLKPTIIAQTTDTLSGKKR